MARAGASLPSCPRFSNPSSPSVVRGRMQTVAFRSPVQSFFTRSWRAAPAAAAVRVFSSSPPSVTEDRSRGGLPRFYSHVLPSSKVRATPPSRGFVPKSGTQSSRFIFSFVLRGSVTQQRLPTLHSEGGFRHLTESLNLLQGDGVRVQGDEFWHMTKVLRLRVNDRVELFNGRGGVVEGYIQNIDRTGLDILAADDPKAIAPKSIQWHVFAAFGSLKGGRGDWLVEKCTELGASSITPLLTERSPSITENRTDRLQRVVLAATKQSGATPLVKSLYLARSEAGGILIIGPEGDFTEEEVELMTERGATPIGLGPCRLRVETATVALLSALMLWSDSEDLSHLQQQHTLPSYI